jgi:hypothetical protein
MKSIVIWGGLFCGAIALALLAFLIADFDTTPQPNSQTAAGSQPAERALESLDRVRVIVLGHEEMSGEFEVDESGMLELPLIGSLLVAGMAKSEVEQIVVNRLKPDYIKDPHVSVEILALVTSPIPTFVSPNADTPLEGRPNGLSQDISAEGLEAAQPDPEGSDLSLPSVAEGAEAAPPELQLERLSPSSNAEKVQVAPPEPPLELRALADSAVGPEELLLKSDLEPLASAVSAKGAAGVPAGPDASVLEASGPAATQAQLEEKHQARPEPAASTQDTSDKLGLESTLVAVRFLLARDIVEREPVVITDVLISFRWYFDDKFVSLYEALVGTSSTWRTWSAQDLKRGKWRVQIATQDGRVISERKFDVQ